MTRAQWPFASASPASPSRSTAWALSELGTWISEAWHAKTKATKAKRALQAERNKALQMRITMLRIYGDWKEEDCAEAALWREAQVAQQEAATEAVKVFEAIFANSVKKEMRPGALL